MSEFSRKISIYVESGQAQQAYDRLKSTQEKLTEQVKKYVDAGKQIPAALTEKLQKTNDALQKQSDLLSGKLTPSLKNLSGTYSQLRRDLESMNQEDAGFELKRKQTLQAKEALEQYKFSLSSVKEGLKSMLNTAKGVALGVIVGSSVQAIVQSVGSMFSGLISGGAKVSDELTDIEKTTNLTAESVKKLNKELSQEDTRTSNSKLRQYATEAGKLGKESIEDVKRFVLEANQIEVALGEDLGENAITQIGKVADIFDTSMTKIGSAINTIGAKSAASEGFQTDFLFRMAGIGKTAQISAADLLGFGATLDINGQQVEASSTALQTFFIDFTKNTEKFGKAAGMVKGSLTEIANTKGINSAFISFLENLKKGSTSTDDLLRKLEAIGIDGARGANTFLALANNIETVKEQQLIANQAFDEGTSIVDEYDKKNNNLAATIEKIQKAWGSLTSSSTMQDFLNAGANLTLNFLKALKQLPEWIDRNSSLLIIAAGAYLGYNAALIASNIQARYAIVITNAMIVVEKAKQALLFVGRGLLLIGTIAQLAWNGSITLGTAANLAFGASLAIASGGLTLIVGALVAAGTAIALYVNSQRESLKINTMLADVRKQAALSVAEEKTTLEELVSIAKDETRSKADRLEAIKKINQISPEYLGNITLETINTNDATKAIKSYIEQLDKKAMQEALHAKRVELNKGLIEEQTKSIEDNVKWYDYLQGTIGGIVTAGSYEKDYYEAGKKRKEGNISIIKKEIEAINELQKKQLGANKPFSMLQPSGTFSSNETGAISGSDGAVDTKTQSKLNSELDRFNQFYLKLLDLKKESEAALISEDEKEIAAVQIKYEKLSTELLEFEKKGIINIQKFNATKALLLEDYYNELDRLNKKQFEKRSENEYEATLFATSKVFERELTAQKEKLAKGEINEITYANTVEAIHTQAIAAKITIAKNYFDTTKKAENDLVKFQQEQYEQDVKNKQDAEKRKADEKKLQSQLGLETAQLGGDKVTEKSIKLRLLEEEYQAQMAHWSLIENGEEQHQETLNAITENYLQKRNDLADEDFFSQSQAFAKRVEGYMGYAQQVVGVMNSIAQIQTNIENAQLNSLKKNHDKKVKFYGDELKSKRLSQKQHDKLVEAANRELAGKEDEIKRKQFERNKAMQIVSAVINTAAAVASAWGTSGNIYAAIAMSVIAAAAGAAQIGVIASQQYQGASYEEGTDSIAKGPSHAQGGIKMIDGVTGQQRGEMEGDEAIINKRTVAANMPIIQKLLSAKGRPISVDVARTAQNVRVFESGSLSVASDTSSPAGKVIAMDTQNYQLSNLIKMNESMLQEMKKFNAKKLTLSLQEINEKNELLDYITDKAL